MSGAAHSPGPWIAVHCADDGGEFSIHAANGIHVALSIGGTKSEAANAHLIAAAPDLLDALKELRNWYQEHIGLPACAANAAISKATGVKP